MVVESELSFYQGVAAAGRCRRHALFLSRRVAPARRMVPAFRGAARWRRRASPATERGHGCLSRGAAAMIGAEGGAVAASGVRPFPYLANRMSVPQSSEPTPKGPVERTLGAVALHVGGPVSRLGHA